MAEIYHAIVTYDVNEKHKEVKAKMLAKGYYKTWAANNKTYFLPNTSVWKNNITVETALADLKSVCSELKVKLERAVATNASIWAAIEGEDFH